MPTIEQLLQRTSRSFALSIPAAVAPVDREVTVAYLLFRIADTIEDGCEVPVARRVLGLELFCQLLRAPTDPACRASFIAFARAFPVQHAGYRELLDHSLRVVDALGELRPGAARIIAEHSTRTATGCIDWITRTDADGVLRLRSLDELRGYCYTVAGIPGEMLCELFLLDRPTLAGVAAQLRARAVVFGEAMQLVNILKDCAADAAEGRVYLPDSVPMADALALARRDLAIAREYVDLLRQPGVEPGVIAFHAITAGLAKVALDVTEAAGSGAKIPRARVAEILEQAGVSSAGVRA